jgi:DNA-binding LytR/AlgR family response regulator
MKWAENILSDSDCIFLRVHNKHLINVDYISKYSRNNHDKVEMIDQSHIPVATRKRKIIINFIKYQVQLIKSIVFLIAQHYWCVNF